MSNTVGVSTGRLVGRQVGDILEGRVNTVDGKLPDTIKVDNPDGSSGFAIRKGTATEEQFESFLRMWKGRSNVDRSDATFNRVLRETGSVEIANLARTASTMRAMQKVAATNAEWLGIVIND